MGVGVGVGVGVVVVVAVAAEAEANHAGERVRSGCRSQVAGRESPGQERAVTGDG